MKDSHSGHSRDVRAPELSQLLARGRVYVDEAVHVADDELLHACGRVGLPLWAETVLWVCWSVLHGGLGGDGVGIGKMSIRRQREVGGKGD